MRGKKAKALRATARRLTAGAPDRAYRRTTAGTLVLDQNCTQGLYKMLKRLSKRGLGVRIPEMGAQ